MIKPNSYMVAVPANPEELTNPDLLLNRLHSTGAFQLLSARFQDETLLLELNDNGETYSIRIYPMDFSIPELYRCQHFFPDVDIEALQRAEVGLSVEMTFGSNPQASYHLQLKLIHTLFPELLAVLDDSSEKILSGRWVTLAAQSAVRPAPRYLYTAQAVAGEENCVWLHTHGLNRCGHPELEVLGSTKEACQNHYAVLETLANRLLEHEQTPELGKPFFLAYVTQNVPLVVTLIDWDEAVDCYPSDMLGGREDREKGHNQDTCAVFAYPSPESAKERRYSSLAIYDEMLKENPIFMISTPETNRMRALAAERLEYLFEAFQNPQNHLLVKLGLKMDKEYCTEDNCLEHIWFEVTDIQNGRFTAKLTQEPYYVSGVHEGYVGNYGPEDLTDWLIFTPERRLTPDDVYLMKL